MLEFKKINVNPKGHRTGDCSTRAIVSTFGISYQEALTQQRENEEPIYTNYIDFNKIHAKIWVKEEIENIKFLKITSLQGFSNSDFVFTCSLLG